MGINLYFKNIKQREGVSWAVEWSFNTMLMRGWYTLTSMV